MANEAFICVAELATGFAFDRTQKTWRPANFRVGSKYLVSKSKTSGEWEYKPAGGRIEDSPCSSEREDELICDDAYGWEFRMNRYNLRFLQYSGRVTGMTAPEHRRSMFKKENGGLIWKSERAALSEAR